MKKILLFVGIFMLVLIAALFFARSFLNKMAVVSPTPSPSIDSRSNPGELIFLKKPSPGQLITGSPLIVTGEARGYWYFEASFPVRIYDANGVELGVVPAQAQGEWMTEEFVPFEAVLKFNKPTTEAGMLVLQRDNPSGLPENDAELSIPVRFDLEKWSSSVPVSAKCIVTGCSGQICSDKDTITTCEYSEEYACFKSAKCERQEDGKCGWTPTEELLTCLEAAFQN